MLVLLVILGAGLGLAAIYDGAQRKARVDTLVSKATAFHQRALEIMRRVSLTHSVSKSDYDELAEAAKGEDVAQSTVAFAVLSIFYDQKIITFDQYGSVFEDKLATCVAPETVLVCIELVRSLTLPEPDSGELLQQDYGKVIGPSDQKRMNKVAKSNDAIARRAIAVEIFARLKKGDAEVGWARGLVQKCESKATGEDKRFWSTMSKAFDKRFGS